jgi:hypothetical protein
MESVDQTTVVELVYLGKAPAEQEELVNRPLPTETEHPVLLVLAEVEQHTVVVAKDISMPDVPVVAEQFVSYGVEIVLSHVH